MYSRFRFIHYFYMNKKAGLLILIVALLLVGYTVFYKKDAVVSPSSEAKNTVVTKQGLQLTLPTTWQVLSVGETELKIKTADTPYRVVETVSISGTYKNSTPGPILYESGDLKLYDEACAPAIRCIGALVGGVSYLFAWEVVESNEPVPANLDGVWFPSANFNANDVLEIMKTLKKV